VPGFILSAARRPRGDVTGPGGVLEGPTSRLATAPWPARNRNCLVIFARSDEGSRRVTLRVRTEPVAKPSPSSSWAPRATPETARAGCTSAPRSPSRGCPAPNSPLVLPRRSGRCSSWSSRRVAAARPTQCVSPSTTLPRPGPRPRQPWAQDQPYGALSLRPTPAFELAFDRSHIVRSPCTVRVWIGAVAKSSASPTWPSRATLRWPSHGARSAAVRASSVPRTKLAARLEGRSQRCRASSSGRGCCPPSSLPEPVHEPAMTRPTAAPSVGTGSGLRAALRQANSRPSSTLSIDRTSCAPRARCVSGSGPWQGRVCHHAGLPERPRDGPRRVGAAPRCALECAPHQARCRSCRTLAELCGLVLTT